MRAVLAVAALMMASSALGQATQLAGDAPAAETRPGGAGLDRLAAATRPAPISAESVADSLGAYVEQLRGRQERWLEAARLVAAGKRDAAARVMGQQPYTDVPVPWRLRHLRLAGALRGEFRTEGGTPRAFGPALWYVDAEAASLAVKAFDEALKAGVPLNFPSTIKFGQALIEAGKYPRARETLSSLLKEDLAADWQRTLRGWIDGLCGLEAGATPPLSFYGRYYVEASLGWYRRRLYPVVAVWRADVPAGQLSAKASLLAALFEKAEDRRGQRLATLWLAEVQAEHRPAASKALLRAAQLAVRDKDHAAAFGLWCRIERKYADTPSGDEAMYLTGAWLRRLGKPREAIAQFRELLAGRGGKGPAPGEAAKVGGVHHTLAALGIGHCMRDMNKYREALAAYAAAEQKYTAWPALYVGLCHDHLGQAGPAARKYLEVAAYHGGEKPSVLIRVLDMYEAAGQVADLKSMFDELDREYRRAQSRKFTDVHVDLPPSEVLRTAIELHQWQAGGRLDKLVVLLKIKGALAGPEDYRARRGNWEAVEAARLLARRPDRSVPLLVQRLATAEQTDRKWLYYTLGRCGTARAVTVLKAAARGEHNIWWSRSVVYALAQAGLAGEAALKDLSGAPHHNLRCALDALQAGQFDEPEKDIVFPTITGGVVLPRSWE